MASATKDEKPTTSTEQKTEQPQQQQKAAFEEDDEFEDFPVQGWSLPLSLPIDRHRFYLPRTLLASHTLVNRQSRVYSSPLRASQIASTFSISDPWLTCNYFYHPDWTAEETEAAGSGGTQHLWEESWDDDDTSDDFSAQLKYVKKQQAEHTPPSCHILRDTNREPQGGTEEGRGIQAEVGVEARCMTKTTR